MNAAKKTSTAIWIAKSLFARAKVNGSAANKSFLEKGSFLLPIWSSYSHHSTYVTLWAVSAAFRFNRRYAFPYPLSGDAG